MLSNERLVVGEKWIFDKKNRKKKIILQIVFWYVLLQLSMLKKLLSPSACGLVIAIAVITDTAGTLLVTQMKFEASIYRSFWREKKMLKSNSQYDVFLQLISK